MEDINASEDGSVRFRFADNTSDQLTVENAVGKNIQMEVRGGEESVLQVGIDSVQADGYATRYVATGKAASVVAQGDSANIWLKEIGTLSANSADYEGKFTTINAAGVEGNSTLAGNNYDNVIVASQGNTSMWGGSGTSDDTLIGGEGSDTFYYIAGEGDDVIQNANEDDTVRIVGMTVSDLVSQLRAGTASYEVSSDSIDIKFASGSLSVENNGAVFQFNQGSSTVSNRWTYDKTKNNGAGGWSKA